MGCTFLSKCSLGCHRLDDRFPQLALVRQKPVVVTPQSLLERCRGPPTQRLDAAAVEQLARCSIRPRPVVDNAPFKAHTTFNVFGEFSNRDVVTGTDIDMRLAGIVPQKMDAGVSEIVDVEELAPRRAAAPDDDFRGARHFGFVKAAQECSRDVAGLGMEIVAGAVKIPRHRRYEIAPMLATVGLTKLDAG